MQFDVCIYEIYMYDCAYELIRNVQFTFLTYIQYMIACVKLFAISHFEKCFYK